MTHPQLSLEEINTLKWYTSDSNNSQHLNESLRKDRELDNDEKYNYTILKNALSKFKLGKHYKVYRGVSVDVSESFNKPYKK